MLIPGSGKKKDFHGAALGLSSLCHGMRMGDESLEMNAGRGCSWRTTLPFGKLEPKDSVKEGIFYSQCLPHPLHPLFGFPPKEPGRISDRDQRSPQLSSSKMDP